MNKSDISSYLLPLETNKTFNLDTFNTEVKQAIALNAELADYLKLIDEPINQELRPASVLIPLVKMSVSNKEHASWQVILTRRAKHLKNHAGEICFPGGRFEKNDGNLEYTAKRETEEEIGIPVSQMEILGRLPKQITISQYYVTPYVGIINKQYAFKLKDLIIDNNEVEEVFVVPLDFLMDPSNHQKVSKKVNNVSFSYHVIAYKDYNIWGATARMLVNFSQLLAPLKS